MWLDHLQKFCYSKCAKYLIVCQFAEAKASVAKASMPLEDFFLVMNIHPMAYIERVTGKSGRVLRISPISAEYLGKEVKVRCRARFGRGKSVLQFEGRYMDEVLTDTHMTPYEMQLARQRAYETAKEDMFRQMREFPRRIPVHR